MQMNIAEAKAKLSELIAAVERGEEVVIARGGSRLCGLYPPGRQVRRFGSGSPRASWRRCRISLSR